MTRQEKQRRLAAAYKRMNPRGRAVLDRLARELADAHQLAASPGSRGNGGREAGKVENGK